MKCAIFFYFTCYENEMSKFYILMKLCGACAVLLGFILGGGVVSAEDEMEGIISRLGAEPAKEIEGTRIFDVIRNRGLSKSVFICKGVNDIVQSYCSRSVDGPGLTVTKARILHFLYKSRGLALYKMDISREVRDSDLIMLRDKIVIAIKENGIAVEDSDYSNIIKILIEDGECDVTPVLKHRAFTPDNASVKKAISLEVERMRGLRVSVSLFNMVRSVYPLFYKDDYSVPVSSSGESMKELTGFSDHDFFILMSSPSGMDQQEREKWFDGRLRASLLNIKSPLVERFFLEFKKNSSSIVFSNDGRVSDLYVKGWAAWRAMILPVVFGDLWADVFPDLKEFDYLFSDVSGVMNRLSAVSHFSSSGDIRRMFYIGWSDYIKKESVFQFDIAGTVVEWGKDGVHAENKWAKNMNLDVRHGGAIPESFNEGSVYGFLDMAYLYNFSIGTSPLVDDGYRLRVDGMGNGWICDKKACEFIVYSPFFPIDKNRPILGCNKLIATGNFFIYYGVRSGDVVNISCFDGRGGEIYRMSVFNRQGQVSGRDESVLGEKYKDFLNHFIVKFYNKPLKKADLSSLRKRLKAAEDGIRDGKYSCVDVMNLSQAVAIRNLLGDWDSTSKSNLLIESMKRDGLKAIWNR